MKFLRKLGLAISYVTCIPAASAADLSDETALEGLAKYLPSVGLIIGSIMACACLVIVHAHTNTMLAAAVLILGWLWLTGGLHMDGFMDTADGVFSHRSRERMLEIMQDSRVGNFAVLAAISILALKIFSLAALNSLQMVIVLLLVPAWARACEVYAIGRFDYARPFGKGKVWHDTMAYPRDLLIAVAPVAMTMAAAAYFDAKTALTASAATIMGGIITAHWLNNKVGGQTGDTYGAVVEAAETVGLLLATINF